MGSELHRFGIDPGDDDKRWRAGIEKFLIALLTNPALSIGDTNSLIAFPDQNPAKGGTTTAAATAAGAFFTQLTDTSGGASDGDISLQGGQVSGGTGNEVVADIKLYDFGTDTWEGTPGQHLILTIDGDGTATSGILDPIFNITAAAASIVSSIPSATTPSVGSETGKVCYVSLGTFIDGGFNPALPGNVSVTFCWGGYTISRF